MKLKGTPGQVVQVRKNRVNGGTAIIPLFVFDEKGFAEVDESKLSAIDKEKLTRLFGYTEGDSNGDNELSEEEIRALAKERKVKSWHTKSIENLKKELGV